MAGEKGSLLEPLNSKKGGFRLPFYLSEWLLTIRWQDSG
jgi:hypothetical protein